MANALQRSTHRPLLDAISSKNLLALYNYELMLVMQLLVRPRDTVGFIIAVEDSLPPPPAKTSVQLAEITTTVNQCVKGLMDLKDIVTFARLNGGSAYCPTGLGFATNPNDRDQYDRPRAVEFGALVKKVIHGHVADNLASYFKHNLSDPGVVPARPNFSGAAKPPSWEEMIETVLQIYEYYRYMAEVSTRLRLDYEGPDSKANRQTGRSEDLTPFRPRKAPEVKHHALAYMEQALEEENFAAMDLIGTLVEGAKEVLGSNLSEEEYDLSNEKGSALARGDLPCFVLVNAPEGRCNKQGCEYNHDPTVVAKGWTRMVYRLTQSQAYAKAKELSLIKPIEFGSAFDPSTIPPRARATVSTLLPGPRLAVRGPSSSEPYGGRAQGQAQGGRRPGGDARGGRGPPGRDHMAPQRSEVHPQRMAQGARESQMHYLGQKDHEDSKEEENHCAEELDYQTREHYACVALTVRLSDDEAEETPEIQYINLMSSLRSPTMMIDIYLPGKEESLSKVQVLMDSGANGCAYISSKCYEKFSSMIPSSSLKPVRSLTSFGGKETQASKFEVVLCLRGEHRGIPVTVSLPFLVLDTDRFEVILGTKAMGRSKALNDITVLRLTLDGLLLVPPDDTKP